MKIHRFNQFLDLENKNKKELSSMVLKEGNSILLDAIKKEPESIKGLYLKKDDEYLSWATYMNDLRIVNDKHLVSAFTKPQYRRSGYSLRMLTALMKWQNRKYYISRAYNKSSFNFFSKVSKTESRLFLGIENYPGAERKSLFCSLSEAKNWINKRYKSSVWISDNWDFCWARNQNTFFTGYHKGDRFTIFWVE